MRNLLQPPPLRQPVDRSQLRVRSPRSILALNITQQRQRALTTRRSAARDSGACHDPPPAPLRETGHEGRRSQLSLTPGTALPAAGIPVDSDRESAVLRAVRAIHGEQCEDRDTRFATQAARRGPPPAPTVSSAPAACNPTATPTTAARRHNRSGARGKGGYLRSRRKGG